MTRTNRIVAAIWLLLGVFVLMVADWLFGGLRFAGRGATICAAFAGLWLPVVCLVLLGFLPRSRTRAWAFAALIPATLFCFSLGPLFVVGQTITSWTRQGGVNARGSEIVTYFGEAGAMDSGEVIVQQEIRLMPGLLWVRPVSRRNGMRDVKVVVLDRHHVRYDYPADKYGPPDEASGAQRDDVWVF